MLTARTVSIPNECAGWEDTGSEEGELVRGPRSGGRERTRKRGKKRGKTIGKRDENDSNITMGAALLHTMSLDEPLQSSLSRPPVTVASRPPY